MPNLKSPNLVAGLCLLTLIFHPLFALGSVLPQDDLPQLGSNSSSALSVRSQGFSFNFWSIIKILSTNNLPSSIYATLTHAFNSNNTSVTDLRCKQESSVRASDKPKSFALIATGSHIKLYPFSDSLNIAGEHYVLLPNYQLDLNISQDNQFYFSTEWSTGKNLNPKLNLNQRLKGNYLPGIAPKITEVDFLFDWTFCDKVKPTRGNDDCLVVVWLDEANKLARYGSIDLRKQPIQTNIATNSSGRVKALFLKEYPPIDPVFLFNTTDIEVHTLRVEKNSGAVALACSVGSKLPNRLIFGYLESSSEKRTHRFQLRDGYSRSIDSCPCIDGEDHSPIEKIKNKEQSSYDFTIEPKFTMEFKPQKLVLYALMSGFGCYPRETPNSADLVVLELNKLNLVSEKKRSCIHSRLPLVALSVDPKSEDAMALDSESDLIHFVFEGQVLLSPYVSNMQQMHLGTSSSQIYEMQLTGENLIISDLANKTLVTTNIQETCSNFRFRKVLLAEPDAIYGFRLGELTGNRQQLVPLDGDIHDLVGLNTLTINLFVVLSIVFIIWLFLARRAQSEKKIEQRARSEPSEGLELDIKDPTQQENKARAMN